MESKEYQKKVLRTDVEDYSGFQTRLAENRQTVHTAIRGFMISSGVLDLMKKKIAYDAQPDKLFRIDAENSAILLNFNDPIFLDKIAESEKLSQLLHYIIGMITECNELMVALTKGAVTGNLDIINIGEEISDVEWYKSILCERLGLDVGQLLDANIKKLEARYPEKFNNDNANIRNLKVERDILENNIDANNI